MHEHLFKCSNGRLIIVSAIAHRWGKLKFDDITLKNNYNKMYAYGQACSARCVWAKQFTRQYNKNNNNGWLAYSIHPGIIMTELQNDFTLGTF